MRRLKEFEKWYKNSGCVWLFQLGCTNEAKFKVAWKAALEYIKRELHAAKDGFEPDLGLHNLLEKELNG